MLETLEVIKGFGEGRSTILSGLRHSLPRWGVPVPSDVLHVTPHHDLIQHDTSTTDADCVCGPLVEPVPRADGSCGWLLIHHSLDRREARERATG